MNRYIFQLFWYKQTSGCKIKNKLKITGCLEQMCTMIIDFRQVIHFVRTDVYTRMDGRTEYARVVDQREGSASTNEPVYTDTWRNAARLIQISPSQSLKATTIEMNQIGNYACTYKKNKKTEDEKKKWKEIKNRSDIISAGIYQRIFGIHLYTRIYARCSRGVY